MSEDKQAEVPLVVSTAPERIYLQVSDDAFDNGNPFPPNWQDATWCHESVVDCEVEYIRADLADTPSSAEPVSRVVEMPGSSGGFTMAVFEASKVPVGFELYTRPSSLRELSNSEIANIANEVHISMPDDADDQMEMLAIVKAVLEAARKP